LFTVDAEAPTTGCYDIYVWRVGKDAGDEVPDAVEHVLAVVEQEQALSSA